MSQFAAEQVRTRADLGRELSALRARSGLSLRQLARQVDAPVATLGDYFAGRHLPGPAQLGLYRSILAACGVTDPAEVEAWTEALTRARFASDGRAPKSVAPYRGLEPFREDDRELFFGRRAATFELIERLRALAADPGPSRGVLVLVGPSGSGKSSLLAAGVVPAVRAGALDTPGDSWQIHRERREWLRRMLGEPVPGPTVVVTHHAPSDRSISTKYSGDTLNAAFASDLTDLMGPAVLWIHGHMHNSSDYIERGTRVICNPRGYMPFEPNPDFNPDLVVEVL